MFIDTVVFSEYNMQLLKQNFYEKGSIMPLNLIAGVTSLFYALGMPTYLLVFNQTESPPFVAIVLILLDLLAFGIFFMCYNKENPQETKK